VFGTDILQTFYDLATCSQEPLKKEALQRVEVLAQVREGHHHHH
jgi:hypothetical protein